MLEFPHAALLGFAVAAAAAAGATPLVARLALSLGVVDRPDARKINRRPDIPLLGGLAVAAGFVLGIVAALATVPVDFALGRELVGLVAGGSILIAVGIVDDRRGLSAGPKLGAQVAAAAVAIAFGYEIEYVRIPVTLETFWFPPAISWPLTALFIVGVTNSLNLLDGMDGISTGVGLIIAATLTSLCLFGGGNGGVLMGAAFSGALLGFLPFNYPPARIFLGDTGALFIGFTLSLLALESYRQAVFVPFIVPLLALSVPMIDTSLSILRRVRGRRRIFAADRHHMHHRMLEIFGSQRAAAHQMYGITFIFCLISFFITRLRGYWFLLYLSLIVLLTLKMVHNFGLFGTQGSSTTDTEAAPERR
ncbi:MAG: undecaprenyl/decaprenyl-phosphate alpha-N-acetylglucosaminyl 1-phosphate transferase [Deltaproteobacteria bacterium]|nr:MAG: undecaprenyl/decaprenyl-phosphate alpha-N-acetylglucosaminyl 1-phosphate transferase [Deltaproteobacteria bacterium]